ncbi:MAG: patatin-like phospholipase family protein [Flavobacterium sp.]|nr:patatin-like phospholipase family protein [Flavobacterium sp.]
MAWTSLSIIFLLSTAIFFFQKKKEKRFPLLSGLVSSCIELKLAFKKNYNFTNLKSLNLAIFIVFFMLFTQLINAQDTIKRPKIGLILSGGGAKGFAHIGVLKVLESAGVKIDYIGGTSMGAVVGGLYASGYSASQIDSIFTSTNFDKLLQDYIPRTSKSFFEKHNDELYAISLPFKKFNIGIPIALSKGLYNYNLLTSLTHKVRNINDFNKLPIPFLCIATDIETGKEVLLNKGYLPQAMLASSAFPSLFSPVEIDGKLLVDGGVSNNYPIEEVRKLGADIIIGVDVQDGLKDRKSLKDATRILVQITNLQMIEKMKEKSKDTDIYIKPKVADYSVISFDKGEEIIKIGEDATIEVYDKIKLLGNLKDFKIRTVKKEADSLQLNQIENNDLKRYTRAYIIGKLGFKQGMKISYEDLKNGINKLNATQNFSTINYTISKFNGGDKLDLKLTESSNNTFLKFGLHFDGLYKSAILVNLTQKKSLLKNDVFSLDLGLGDNFRYNLDYYVDNGFYFSFGFKSRFNQFSRNITADFINPSFLNNLNLSTVNVDFSDLTNQAYIQTIFAQKFLIGLGIELKHIKISTQTLQNATSVFENSDYASIFGYLKYDSYDNKYFPSKGWNFNADLQSYLYSTDFSKTFNRYSVAKFEAGFAKTFYKKTTLMFQTDAGFAIGGSSTTYLNFVLGGYGFNPTNNFKPFYGYDFISLTGNSYIKSNVTIDYEIIKKNHLNFSANFANISNNLFDNSKWISKANYSGYALGYGLETFIGPAEVKYSWSPELQKGFVWFGIGFWF